MPPISKKLAANFPTCTAGDVNTGGKFAAGVNHTGGKLPPVSITPVANNENNIRILTPKSELAGKNLSMC